jgi:pyruvate,water dikinase
VRYSQQFVDLIDLEANQFETLPIHEVLTPRYPVIRYLAQVDEGGFLSTIRSSHLEGGTERLVLTFEELLRRTPMARLLREMLQTLEKHYRSPVDTEFTIRIIDPQALQPAVEICLLQCRPQSQLKDSAARMPTGLNPDDIVFSTRGVVPQGFISNIGWVLFVSPEGYFSLPTPAARTGLGHAISQLNNTLEGEVYICVGPGRWGTVNPDLGVHIAYGDIYNTRALVELAGTGIGMAASEPSFGTHFFQDLVESNIFPLAIYLEDPEVQFNHPFFYDTPNHLADYLPDAAGCADVIRLIEVASFRPAHHLELIMDDEKAQALAYLVPDE